MRKIFYAVSAGLLLLSCGGTQAAIGETRLKIVNNSRLPFKISQTGYVAIPASPSSPAISNSQTIFLGLYPQNGYGLEFFSLPRSLAHERHEFKITAPQQRPVDCVVETGAEWSFALAKSGGGWQNQLGQGVISASATDLWIKAGHHLLKGIDKPERVQMQIGPHTTCRVVANLTIPPYPDYTLTFTDDGAPEAWLPQTLTPGQINVVVANQTPIEWVVTGMGFTQEHGADQANGVFTLGTGDLARICSFNPSLPRPNLVGRDGSIYLTCVPKQSGALVNGIQLAFEKFVLALYQAKTRVKPVVGMGRSAYELHKKLAIADISVTVTEVPDRELRFSIELGPHTALASSFDITDLVNKLVALFIQERQGRGKLEEHKRQLTYLKRRVHQIAEDFRSAGKFHGLDAKAIGDFILERAMAKIREYIALGRYQFTEQPDSPLILFIKSTW